jgi:GTP-binding protein HflX
VVEQVLDEIGAAAVPRLEVWNKIDALSPDAAPPHARGGAVFRISAQQGLGITALLAAIDEALRGREERLAVDLPPSRSDLLAELHRAGRVVQQEFVDGVVRVTAMVPAKLAGRVRKALAAAL